MCFLNAPPPIKILAECRGRVLVALGAERKMQAKLVGFSPQEKIVNAISSSTPTSTSTRAQRRKHGKNAENHLVVGLIRLGEYSFLAKCRWNSNMKLSRSINNKFTDIARALLLSVPTKSQTLAHTAELFL